LFEWKKRSGGYSPIPFLIPGTFQELNYFFSFRSLKIAANV